MRQYTQNFKPEENTSSSIPPLPAGAYIGRVLAVHLEEKDMNQIITLHIDVAEGPYKDYYTKQFQAAQGGKFTPRYKGSYRMTAPDIRDQYYDIKDRIFRSDIWAFEESNSGYRWAWDEQSLKGKIVGFVVRERDWEKDGATGTTTEIGCLTTVQRVRDGKAPQLKRRELKNKKPALPAGAPAGSEYVDPGDEPMPF